MFDRFVEGKQSKPEFPCNYMTCGMCARADGIATISVLTAVTFLEVLKTCASVIAWYPSRHTSSKMHVHDQSIPYSYEASALSSLASIQMWELSPEHLNLQFQFVVFPGDAMCYVALLLESGISIEL
jgi:hypothetical protein